MAVYADMLTHFLKILIAQLIFILYIKKARIVSYLQAFHINLYFNVHIMWLRHTMYIF